MTKQEGDSETRQRRRQRRRRRTGGGGREGKKRKKEEKEAKKEKTYAKEERPSVNYARGSPSAHAHPEVSTRHGFLPPFYQKSHRSPIILTGPHLALHRDVLFLSVSVKCSSTSCFSVPTVTKPL